MQPTSDDMLTESKIGVGVAVVKCERALISDQE